ncbi:tetratricopeptide repeat protein [Moorella sp. ACPs]|uniref:tetratricopeptide repeat protein n=1 Tax=Neomoorella carbonis TaxID=3062783 RepID=UPI003248AF22
MTGSSGHPTTCRINCKPRHAGERKTIAFYLDLTRERIPTCAGINLEGNELAIQGLGYDGRCAFCRCFRKALKNRGIRFNCTCPFEIQDNNCTWRVKIGSVFFHQDLLEDKEKYLSYLRRVVNNPRDLEAWLALGVIHEYHGRFAPALASYWAAHDLDPEDTFIKERLQDILSLLQQLLSTSGQQQN